MGPLRGAPVDVSTESKAKGEYLGVKGINVGLASRRQPVLAYSRRIQVAELIPIYLPAASSAVDKSSRRGRRC